MFRKIFLHALAASALAIAAALVYRRIYFFATEIDFSRVASFKNLFSFCLIFCMVAAGINYLCFKFLKNRAEIIYNLILSAVSFALVMLPISISLPLDIKSPELFPGLAVPIVFFPALSWYTLMPLFGGE
ncbi:MAG: hypothetical protein C5B59_06960 [Bacteroidetes bacterium]|nr:MAG: hypothetical protein C5B59_06960 [Bacteroidota bacterium]